MQRGIHTALPRLVAFYASAGPLRVYCVHHYEDEKLGSLLHRDRTGV
jgi:hypothetical protein